jgi:hypothetical protein
MKKQLTHKEKRRIESMKAHREINWWLIMGLSLGGAALFSGAVLIIFSFIL